MKPIDEEIQELTRTIERASTVRRALLDLKAEIGRLEFQVNSPKTKLLLLEHVDTGLRMGECIGAGMVRATEMLVPSALVERAPTKPKVAEYEFGPFHAHTHPYGIRGARIECALRAGAQLGELLVKDILA
jgi:hypothetical protein